MLIYCLTGILPWPSLYCTHYFTLFGTRIGACLYLWHYRSSHRFARLATPFLCTEGRH